MIDSAGSATQVMEGLAEVSDRGKLDWELHFPAEPCSKTLSPQGKPAVSINSWHNVTPGPDVLEDTCSTHLERDEREDHRQPHICVQHLAAFYSGQSPRHKNKAALEVSETTKISRQAATRVKDETAEPVASHESRGSYKDEMMGEPALAISEAQGTVISGRTPRAADSQPPNLADHTSNNSEYVSSASRSPIKSFNN